MVAAAVVGSLALSGAVTVDRWTEEQASVEVPGARTIAATEAPAPLPTITARFLATRPASLAHLGGRRGKLVQQRLKNAADEHEVRAVRALDLGCGVAPTL